MIDIHSHILPGIDDGCTTFEESLELIKLANMYGVSDIVLTPHFMFGTEYASSNQIKIELYNKLKEKVKQENIPVNLYLGNEVYAEYNLQKFLDENKILTLNNSRYLLFELPRHGEFKGVYDEVFNLETRGIVPILAHPERYEIIMNNLGIALKLKEQGVLFQANLGSFFGLYGKKVQETVILLLKHHCIDFLASDIHNPTHCHYKKIDEVKEILKKYITEEEIDKLLIENQRKIIKNEEIKIEEPIPFKKNLFGKWK